MLKLKVGTGFQVWTVEQKAQPTLVHLLKLVKIKIHSRLGSCRSRCNYYIGDCCLNLSRCNTRLFKDMLSNLIHVSQDSCPHRGEASSLASCLSLVSPSNIQDKHLAFGRFILNRGEWTSSHRASSLTHSTLLCP